PRQLRDFFAPSDHPSAALSLGVRIGLGPNVETNWRARQVKGLSQAINQVAAVGLRQARRARGKQNESWWTRLRLRHVIEAHRSALDRRRRMTADRFAQEAIERGRRYAPVPDGMPFHCPSHHPLEPFPGAGPSQTQT